MDGLSGGPPPTQPGTYLLWFAVAKPLTLVVGRLGKVQLDPGSYVYMGSALGSGGLRGRMARHLPGIASERNLVVNKHWHVDYLVAACPPVAYRYRTTKQRLECNWASTVHQAGAQWIAKGFGSSDCRQGCQSHLLCLPAVWTLGTLEDLLR